MIVKAAATCCDSGSVGFGLFGAYVNCVAQVGDFFVLRYFGVWYPVEGVHAFRGAVALGQATKFVFA